MPYPQNTTMQSAQLKGFDYRHKIKNVRFGFYFFLRINYYDVKEEWLLNVGDTSNDAQTTPGNFRLSVTTRTNKNYNNC